MTIIDLWNEIKSHIKFNEVNSNLLESLFSWLTNKGFRTGDYPYINEYVFKIMIHYENYTICILEILDWKKIKISKPHRSEKNTELIQKRKKYFNDFWKDNIPQYIFELDEISILKNIFDQILDVFIKDITLDFRINSLELTNYRCFREQKIKFNTATNVFIGNNASGKTTILDSVTHVIGGFLSGIDELKYTESGYIDKHDIRFIIKEIDSQFVKNYNTPTRIDIDTSVINHTILWARALQSLKSRTTTGEAKKIINIVRQIVYEIRNEETDRQIILPVFSYHGMGRTSKLLKDMKKMDRVENISRFFGYDNCLMPDSDYKVFIAWYRKMKYQAFEFQKEIPVLNQVTQSILKCLSILTQEEEELKVMDIKYFEGEIHVVFANGNIEPISRLSDGFRDVIGIISGIAFRMAILNPHLNNDVIKKTPGIVLIDEIDLHLHPKWQQKILKIYREIFPNVQFIITTHSPIILSVTEIGEAFKISRIKNKSNENSIYINEIGNPQQWYFADILTQSFDVDVNFARHINKDFNQVTLEEKIRGFSDKAKEYLVANDLNLKNEIETLYSEIIPSIPQDTPKRRIVDALMGLIK